MPGLPSDHKFPGGAGIKQQEAGACGHEGPGAEFGAPEGSIRVINDCGNRREDTDRTQVVAYRIFSLSDEEAEQHRGAVACESAPSAGHISPARDAKHYYRHHDGCSDGAHHRTPQGLVAELVPERQIEVDAHEDFCQHHDRHHLQADTIARTDKMLEYRHIHHYGEESEQGEDDEILHAVGERFRAVLVAAAAEHDGLVGVTEGLCEKGHDHGNLGAGTVDSELHLAFSTGNHYRIEYLRCNLIEHSHQAQNEQRPAVSEKAPGKAAVEAIRKPLKFIGEPEGHQKGADQVDEENQAHSAVEAGIEIR